MHGSFSFLTIIARTIYLPHFYLKFSSQLYQFKIEKEWYVLELNITKYYSTVHTRASFHELSFFTLMHAMFVREAGQMERVRGQARRTDRCS
jgi:hypothetical protein